MKKEKYLLRFVPTMRCNFACDYCFLGKSENRPSATMFDKYSVETWVDAMKKYEDKDIEIYMWGGEPFMLNDTYVLLKNWLEMDHIVSGCRIDTNMFYVDKIIEECPSSKLKLNCSFHMQYLTLDEELKRAEKLKKLDMIGMVNFVASEYNMRKLKNEYNMTVFELIDKFSEIGVFLNVAGDFALANNTKYNRRDEYMAFILQFISPSEWELLRGSNKEVLCDACRHFFTVNYDGKITCCVDDREYGNFFDGEINPSKIPMKCNKTCQSIIGYPWRMDNECIPWNSLLEYIKRNEDYRKTIQDQKDFIFH